MRDPDLKILRASRILPSSIHPSLPPSEVGHSPSNLGGTYLTTSPPPLLHSNTSSGSLWILEGHSDHLWWKRDRRTTPASCASVSDPLSSFQGSNSCPMHGRSLSLGWMSVHIEFKRDLLPISPLSPCPANFRRIPDMLSGRRTPPRFRIFGEGGKKHSYSMYCTSSESRNSLSFPFFFFPPQPCAKGPLDVLPPEPWSSPSPSPRSYLKGRFEGTHPTPPLQTKRGDVDKGGKGGGVEKSEPHLQVVTKKNSHRFVRRVYLRVGEGRGKQGTTIKQPPSIL
ncbi:hypothetical protein IE53DRAFT_256967 [Violaceomyces palustris]|uniref:Uncharacterized protein n=1 Tax=Violaceomyces palustris TaxID=1673888 RepID=A0ACD0P3X9_9BASI|nr:hypothetical protein IE53DRAFT_256967 [Violaceomyces palustris]